MKKAIIIILIAAILVGVGIWVFTFRTDEWKGTVRLYNPYYVDLKLDDDTSIDDSVEYIEADCNFKVVHNLVSVNVEGKIKINGKDYNVFDRERQDDGITIFFDFDDRISGELSYDLRCIRLLYKGTFWVMSENSIGDLKESLKSFGREPSDYPLITHEIVTAEVQQ